MNRLEEFLSNGRLPFVGREGELLRIGRFAGSIADARGLRIALVNGEAGVGKSRFVEELVPLLSDRRIVVAHVKLHAESNISIDALVASALDRADIGLRLLKVRPDDTHESVVRAMRRLSRLRPTLLIVEDIEQLQGNGLPPFAALISALADETMAVLCLARPVELEARGVIERYLVDEFTIPPLDESDVAFAYQQLFQATPPVGVIGAMMSATGGNALAIRAALRGAVQSGALGIDSDNGEWRLTVPEAGLTALFKQNVRTVSHGLAAHLSTNEKAAAGQLAVLGVVFSREAARLLLPDAEAMIEALSFKGIIATANTSVLAVNLKVSDHPPLVFTHSLTQGQMAEKAHVDPDLLVDLVAAAPPLYSIAPFQFLLDHAGSVSSECKGVRQAILEALIVARTIDKSAAWQKRVVPWGAATGLISRFVAEWDAQVCGDMQATLLRFDFFLHARNPLDQKQLVDRIMVFTRGEHSRPMCEARLVALAHWLHDHVHDAEGVFNDVDDMLDRHPLLSGSSSYCYFLGEACDALFPHNDRERLARLEARLARASSSAWLDDEGRRQLLESQLRLLTSFDTPEELEGRFALLDRLEMESSRLGRRIDLERAELLFETGRADDAAAAISSGLKYADERGLRERRWALMALQLGVRALLGESCETIDNESTRVINSIAEGRVAPHRADIGRRVVDVALLDNQPEWARRTATNYLDHDEDISPVGRILLHLLTSSDMAGTSLPVTDVRHAGAPFATLVSMYVSGDDIESAVVAIPMRALADAPILRLSDLLRIRTAVVLAESILGRNSRRTAPAGARDSSAIGTTADPLGASVAMLAHKAIEWMAHPQRRLDRLMSSSIDQYARYFGCDQAEAWREKATAIRADREARSDDGPADQRIVLSVIGSIEATFPSGQVDRMSGLRVRTLIGLMIANRMLRYPLPYDEFCRIAAGSDVYDKAARVTTNGIVWRLREQLGHDAIDTTGETPEFNPLRVRVDLLEARRLVDEATLALKSDRPLHAVASANAALDIMQGGVPFPAL